MGISGIEELKNAFELEGVKYGRYIQTASCIRNVS